jgi:hypothetical protein
MECKKEQNKQECTCTYDCAVKGMCCDCIRFHRERGEIPGCLFPSEAEATYDRSIRKFVEVWQKRV